jgi:hypothetical protein
MPLPNFCKRLFLTTALILCSLHPFAAQEHEEEKKADAMIEQIYRHLNDNPNLTMPARIEFISGQFLGKPYLLGALGEGADGDYDQWPLYRADAFDCETYVDTVLGIALTRNATEFKQGINHVRYFNGHVSFINRNHFTCLDWNQNNQRQGFVRDITATIKGPNDQSVIKFAKALIDKPSWYEHMTLDTIRLSQANTSDKMQRLQTLKQEGSQLPKATSIIPYLPLDSLFDSTGKANDYLFKQIPNAAIIEIVRPNWDLSKEIGTHLNISHLGFAIWKNSILYFREASSQHGRVVDVPLVDYLRDTLKNPTIKGINVQVVLPQVN